MTESTGAFRCVLDHLKIFTLNDDEIQMKISPDVLYLCSNLALNDSKMRNTACIDTLTLQMTSQMRSGLYSMDQSIRFGLRV